jgi:hypothetical protein
MAFYIIESDFRHIKSVVEKIYGGYQSGRRGFKNPSPSTAVTGKYKLEPDVSLGGEKQW